jgi:hypothetical protein
MSKARTNPRFFLFTVLVLVNLSSWSQPKILWDSTFGTKDQYNFGVSQISNDDGIVYIGSKGNQTKYPWIWKFDAAGNVQWDKIYGEEYSFEANSIKQTSDDGYILTGRVNISELIYGLWILKLNKNGDSLWSRSYGNASFSKGNDIVANSDGSCFIAGQMPSPDNSQNYLLILKINDQGDTLWTKKYENSLSYSCASLIKCTQGGYAAIATIDSTGEAALYSQIIRFDENGDTLWTKEPPSGNLFNSISETSDNGFVVSGMQLNGTNWDLLLLKTNSEGEKEWSRTFGGKSWEMGNEAKQLYDGGYIIAGTKPTSDTSANLDAWLIKTDNSGNKIWSNTYGGAELNERALQVFITADNGYYITGNVKHLFWLARLETDTITVATGIHGNSIVPEYKLGQNYPNPFTSSTVIEYMVPTSSKVVISIFNVNGEKVIQLIDKELPAGQYSVTWNGEDREGNKISTGIYFYQMIVEDKLTKSCTRVLNKLIYYK